MPFLWELILIFMEAVYFIWELGTSCVRAPGGKKLLVGVGVVVRSFTPLMMAEAASANVLPLLLLAFSISGHRSPAQEFVGNVSGAATCTYVYARALSCYSAEKVMRSKSLEGGKTLNFA